MPADGAAIDSAGGDSWRAAGSIAEFPVLTAATCPSGIAAGPDGALWFTEFSSDKIGRITLVGGVSEFSLSPGSAPTAIAAGGDGNLWFTERGSLWAPYSVLGGDAIGRITPTGTVTEFPIATPRSQPDEIVSCPSGGLWFTESWAKNLASITPTGALAGTINEFRIPSLADGLTGGPSGIACDTDSNIWFAEYAANRIGQMTPGGDIHEFPVPSPLSGPAHIATGADGNLWFTESSTNKIGRITISGTITEFDIPTTSSYPNGITAGSDGNVWFVESQGNKIGRISPAGTVTEFPLPSPGSEPVAIVGGPDGNLWFTECAGNKIGRISP